MDAVTYLKAKIRMCSEGCDDCRMSNKNNGVGLHCDAYNEKYPENSVAIVEKWLSEHPPVTYASKMREVFPNFDTDSVCLRNAININCVEVDCDNQDCEACWNREYGSLEEK